MKITQLIFVMFLCACNTSGQPEHDHTERKEVHFSIRIGTYANIPDSVTQAIADEHPKLIPATTCTADKKPLTKVVVGTYPCYHQAEQALLRWKNAGYVDAFILGYIGERAVPSAEAKQLPQHCDEP